MDISFVIPCYNEEDNIFPMYQAVSQVFSGQGITFECVFVNDGSKDATGKRLRELFRENPDGKVTVVNFSRNFGKEAAIYSGLHHVKGDFTCIIDADLQQNPKVALDMYRKLTEDPDTDAVAAYQIHRHENKLLEKLKNGCYRLLNQTSDIDFKQGASDFRMCRRNVIDAILSLPEVSRFSKGIFSWVGFNTVYIPYTAEKRHSGKTKWSFHSLFHYGIDGLIGYSTAPLKLATFLGLLFSALSIIYMLFVVIRAMVTDIPRNGYTTIVGLVLLIGGLLLLMLGIIGEYLAKIYMQVKNRPIYIEKDVLSSKGNENGKE